MGWALTETFTAVITGQKCCSRCCYIISRDAFPAFTVDLEHSYSREDACCSAGGLCTFIWSFDSPWGLTGSVYRLGLWGGGLICFHFHLLLMLFFFFNASRIFSLALTIWNALELHHHIVMFSFFFQTSSTPMWRWRCRMLKAQLSRCGGTCHVGNRILCCKFYHTVVYNFS